MNKIIPLLLIIVLTASIVTLFPLAKGVTMTYGGVIQNSPVSNFTPALSFSIPKGAVLYDEGNFNLGFVANVQDGGLQFQSGICSISYTASWEANQPVELYNVTLATPEYLASDLSGLTGLQQYVFRSIDLTDVPVGPQQITVTVEGGAYYINLATAYYTVYTTASFSLDFTIKAALSSMPAQNSTSWTLETVSADGISSANCPIAVDSNGVPHVAYTAYTTTVQTLGGGPNTVLPDFVEYATWNGISWSTQTVDLGTQVYSLEFDSNNTACLVYEGLNGLMYATLTRGNWTIQNVDPNGASDAALAFDSADNPHVAYDVGTTVNYESYTTVKYASWTGSSWQIQTVDNLPANVPAWAAAVYLTLNQTNTPYLMYGYSPHQNGTDIVQLAIGKNAGWDIQTVSLPSPISGFGNIVLDSKGYPHFISTQAGVNITEGDNLFYVSWNGTGWTTQEVASNIPLEVNGEDIGSVALDVHNNPHILYATPDRLMYASWTGKSWSIQFVQTAAGYVGSTEPGFLALDSSGNPHISFWGSVVSDADYSQGVPILSIVDVMYATVKQASQSAVQKHPSSMPNQLVTIIVAVIVVIVAVSLLLYERNRKKHLSAEHSLSLKEPRQTHF